MRRLLTVTALLCLLVPIAAGQVPVALAPVAHMQFLNNAGQPLASGCVFTFQAGTTNPAATYTDSTGTAQNTNPIILNAGGFADIWLPNAAFKFQVESFGGSNCASGATLWTVDNITGVLGLLNLNNVWTASNTFSQAVAITVNANQLLLGAPGNVTTINAPVPAGNVTLILPNTADTLVGRATTDTLTNKTLTAPVVNSPIVNTPTINGASTGTGVQGTDTKLLSSGTVAGTGIFLCTDALGGATTAGCVTNGAAIGCTAAGPVTISANNALQTLLSCTIPANTLIASSMLRVDVTGINSTASVQTISINTSLGGGTPCATTSATTGVAVNQPWHAQASFSVLTVGAGGTGNWACEYFAGSNGGSVVGSFGVVGAPTISINTTVVNTLLIQEQMSVNNAGNSVTAQLLKAVVY